MKEEQDLAGLDIDELTPAQLRKLLRRVMAKGLKDKDEGEKEEELRKSEEEREKLSKLREEKNGKGPSPDVTKDDVPEELRDEEEDEDEKDSKKE